MYWVLLYIILIFIGVLSFFNKQNEKSYSILSFMIAYLFTINGYFNGVDWVNYGTAFQDAKTFDDFLWGFEPLFGVFLYICKSLFDDFYVSIIIFYTFVYILLYVSISRFFLKINRTVFLAFFITINDLALLNDQLRQLVAVVVCVLGLNYLITNKYRKFVISNFLASLFHYSAMITVVIYPIILQKKKVIVFSGLSILSLFSIVLSIPDFLAQFFSSFGFIGGYIASKISFYAATSESRFGFLVVMDIMVILFYMLNKLPDDYQVAALWSGVFISACLHISFYSFPVFQRLNPYFFIFYCFLGSYYLNGELFHKSRRGLFCVVLTVSLSIVCFYKYYSDDMRQDFFDYDSYLIKYITGDFNFQIEKSKKCDFLGKANSGFCRW